jgi:hypothetical protein
VKVNQRPVRERRVGGLLRHILDNAELSAPLEPSCWAGLCGTCDVAG